VKRHYLISGAALVACLALTGTPSFAALTITSAGAADGFSLSTFSTLPQSGPYGSWGSAILSNGNVVVNGYNPTNLGQTVNFVFSDVDGHTVSSALSTSVWNDGNYASALAALNGTVYGTHYSDNTVRVVNLDGSEGAVVSDVGRGGLGADAARDSLLVATDAGIQEIDLTNSNPATNHRVITTAYADGVTVSADGSRVYGEIGGAILGYDIASGMLVYTSPGLGSPDGVGIVTSGALAGDLIVNANNGIVDLINTTTNTVTTIASGGSRGDYVGFDTSNGTLFLSQSDSLLRLSVAGGTIGGGGGGNTGVPEPATWTAMLLGFGIAGGALRWRRRAPTRFVRHELAV